MSGLAFMFCCLIAIGALGFFSGNQVELAIGILLVISTLANMITIGPACYPIVAETPSGRLRYKTITIGRFVYNLTGIFSNSVTPRMIQATGKLWYPSGVAFADCRQRGIGAQRLDSSTLVLIFYASYGAGLDCPRRRTELSER